MFNLGIKWLRVVSFTLLCFIPVANIARYPLNKRLGESRSQSARFREEVYFKGPAADATEAPQP
jgi:hypothetical protein